jgi:anti-sigma regulatory factor (Ser/Thr protein kinase)
MRCMIDLDGAPGAIRRAVRGFLSYEAPDARLDALELAIGEMLTNVLRHTDGGAHILIQVDDRQVCFRVTDTGRSDGDERPGWWNEEPDRRHGLGILRALAQDVGIEQLGRGTAVQATFPRPG